MVLEATMIAIDNSEYMRNGDYAPSRYDAQLTAMEFIFQSKVNSNPENTVGLLLYGDKGPQILSTLTTDFGKILSGSHEVSISGQSHFCSGIQVAALALKHRQNKVLHQRIVIFVGSPIEESDRELEKLAKKMKKNNIAIDVINFGEEGVNSDKLDRFQQIINNQDNSHLITVPPGPRMLYEAIATSPILMEEGFDMGSGNGGGGGYDPFGDIMDPNADPDLALALRLSLEEEKARQEREAKKEEHQPLKDEQLEKIDESKEDDKDDDHVMEENNTQ